MGHGPAALQGCFDAEMGRLEARLEASLARSDRRFVADHETWRAGCRDRCDRDNPHHEGWGRIFDVQNCYLEELRRRIAWMESTGH